MNYIVRLSFCFIILLILGYGIQTNMQLKSNEKKLIQDEKIFAKYFSNGKLTNKKIDDFFVLNKATIFDASLSNFSWNSFDVIGDFNNIIFKNGILSNGSFEGSNFTNVTFSNVELYNLNLDNCIFKNVKFINCKMNNMHYWQQSETITIEFINSTIDHMAMLEFSGTARFTNSIIKLANINASKVSGEIFIDGGDFQGRLNGELKNIIVKNAKLFDAAMTLKSTDEIYINANKAVILVQGNIKNILVENIGYLSYLDLGKGIKNILVKNIKSGDIVNHSLKGERLGSVKFLDANIDIFRLHKYRGSLHLENVNTMLWTFEGAVMDTLSFKNITMLEPKQLDYPYPFKINRDLSKDYFLNLKNANIQTLRIDNFIALPRVKVDTTDSKFNKIIEVQPSGAEKRLYRWE